MEKFYVLNPAIPPKMRSPYTEDEQFQASEFATLSPERTEEEFQKAKYLANRQELDLYAGLDETLAKQKFLYRFWKGRDPDPETTFNEKLEEFRENVRYADQNFANLRSKQGWKTDKGRILLKYGKPSQIDRYYTFVRRN
jgi:GWxTD domain-containing protein